MKKDILQQNDEMMEYFIIPQFKLAFQQYKKFIYSFLFIYLFLFSYNAFALTTLQKFAIKEMQGKQVGYNSDSYKSYFDSLGNCTQKFISRTTVSPSSCTAVNPDSTSSVETYFSGEPYSLYKVSATGVNLKMLYYNTSKVFEMYDVFFTYTQLQTNPLGEKCLSKIDFENVVFDTCDSQGQTYGYSPNDSYGCITEGTIHCHNTILGISQFDRNGMISCPVGKKPLDGICYESVNSTLADGTFCSSVYNSLKFLKKDCSESGYNDYTPTLNADANGCYNSVSVSCSSDDPNTVPKISIAMISSEFQETTQNPDGTGGTGTGETGTGETGTGENSNIDLTQTNAVLKDIKSNNEELNTHVKAMKDLFTVSNDNSIETNEHLKDIEYNSSQTNSKIDITNSNLEDIKNILSSQNNDNTDLIDTIASTSGTTNSNLNGITNVLNSSLSEQQKSNETLLKINESQEKQIEFTNSLQTMTTGVLNPNSIVDITSENIENFTSGNPLSVLNQFTTNIETLKNAFNFEYVPRTFNFSGLKCFEYSSNFHGKTLTLSLDITEILPRSIVEIFASIIYLLVYLSISIISILFLFKYGIVVLLKSVKH